MLCYCQAPPIQLLLHVCCTVLTIHTALWFRLEAPSVYDPQRLIMRKFFENIKESRHNQGQGDSAQAPQAPAQAPQEAAQHPMPKPTDENDPRGQHPGPVIQVSDCGPVASVQFLGEVLSTNCELIRDLGFSGNIGDTYINCYGDVLICGNGSAGDRIKQKNPMIITSNCAALGTEDPCRVTEINPNGRHARMFCTLLPDETPGHEYAVGITNVIPLSDTHGVVYFLLNWRKGGINRMQGAGVAVVDVTGPHPTCERIGKYWWDSKSEPWYGDHSAVIGQDNWTYVYGGVNEDKRADKQTFYDGMYLCRVPHGKETDLASYQYWNGEAFTTERISPSQKNAVLGPGSTGGMITWNPYLRKYLYIFTTFNVIIGRTADRPEGPWSPHFKIKPISNFPFVYCPSQQYRYDPSGKTLVVSYTAHPNQIFALRITFA